MKVSIKHNLTSKMANFDGNHDFVKTQRFSGLVRTRETLA